MWKRAVTWGLREMGSVCGRGARAGLALQKGGKLSSQRPTKAGTTWGRMRRTNQVERDGEDRHEQSEQSSDQVKFCKHGHWFMILIIVLSVRRINHIALKNQLD
jgi:hypothetical protein